MKLIGKALLGRWQAGGGGGVGGDESADFNVVASCFEE